MVSLSDCPSRQRLLRGRCQAVHKQIGTKKRCMDVKKISDLQQSEVVCGLRTQKAEGNAAPHGLAEWEMLGGSFVVINGLISPLIAVITIVTLLLTHL